MVHAVGERHVMAQISRRFYEGGETKRAIADDLGLSRFKVARLLEQALAEGVVRIEIERSVAIDDDLGARLRAAAGLRLAVVVADGDRRHLAIAAAAWLPRLLVAGETMGVGWGSTLGAVGLALPDGLELGGRVVQGSGGVPGLAAGDGAEETTALFARRLGSVACGLAAPALIDDARAYDALLASPAVGPTVELYSEVTSVLLGVGAFGSAGRSALVRSGFLDAAAAERLRARGAVGDLLVYPFDRQGRIVDLEARAIAVPLEALRRAQVIAIAGGPGKELAVAGALATGLVDVLVTDAACARVALGDAPS